MMGKMKPNRMVRMAEIKLGKPKAILSAFGRTRSSARHLPALEAFWKRSGALTASHHPGTPHDWTTEQKIYHDSELFISCTVSLLEVP